MEMPQFPKLAGAEAHFDSPQPGASAYAECISVSGWCRLPQREAAQCRIRAWLEGHLIGETNTLYVRPDVCAVFRLPDDTPTGFRFLGRLPGVEGSARETVISLTASWRDKGTEYELATSPMQLFPASLAQRPYGDVVHPERDTLLHRENIYGSGPPLEEPGVATLELIRDYLPPRGAVLDVGCGAGAYGPALIAAGHEWLGLETNAYC